MTVSKAIPTRETIETLCKVGKIIKSSPKRRVEFPLCNRRTGASAAFFIPINSIILTQISPGDCLLIYRIPCMGYFGGWAVGIS